MHPEDAHQPAEQVSGSLPIRWIAWRDCCRPPGRARSSTRTPAERLSSLT